MSDVQRYIRYRYFRKDINPGDGEQIVSWDDLPDGVSWDDIPDTITWGDIFSYTNVLQSTMGNVKSGTGIAHFCNVCQLEYRESDLVRFRGLWYCIPKGHNKDIQSILLVENMNAVVPNSVNEAASADLIITEAE